MRQPFEAVSSHVPQLWLLPRNEDCWLTKLGVACSPPPYRRRSPTPDRYRRRSPSYDRAGRDYRRRSPSYDKGGRDDRRRSPSYEPPPRRRSPSYEPRVRCGAAFTFIAKHCLMSRACNVKKDDCQGDSVSIACAIKDTSVVTRTDDAYIPDVAGHLAPLPGAEEVVSVAAQVSFSSAQTRAVALSS